MVPDFEIWGATTGVLGLLLLALVRLASERSFGTTSKARHAKQRRWSPVNADKRVSAHGQSGKTRSFMQYMLETIWAYGAGVMAAHWTP